MKRKCLEGFSIWCIIYLASLIIGKFGWAQQGYAFIYCLIIFYIIIGFYQMTQAKAESDGETNESLKFDYVFDAIIEGIIMVAAIVCVSILFTLDHVIVLQIVFLGLFMAKPPINLLSD